MWTASGEQFQSGELGPAVLEAVRRRARLRHLILLPGLLSLQQTAVLAAGEVRSVTDEQVSDDIFLVGASEECGSLIVAADVGGLATAIRRRSPKLRGVRAPLATLIAAPKAALEVVLLHGCELTRLVARIAH